MTYLDELGAEIRGEVDPRHVPQGDTEQLFRLYAVLLLAKGEHVTAEDVHNAWAAWMAGGNPSHEAVLPFSELDAATQAEDAPFVVAIRRVAGRRR